MTVLIIDATNIASRAYYTSKRTLFSMIDKARRKVDPTHLVCCFDPPGETFRHRLYPEYKATRSKDEERSLFCQQARDAFIQAGVPSLVIDDYEADDVCSEIAVLAWWEGYKSVIMSSDHDMFQMAVGDSIQIMHPVKQESSSGQQHLEWIIEGYSEIADRVGVEAWQLPFLKALEGDKSDNIPGIKGVGRITACRYVNQYQSPLVFLDYIKEVESKKIKAFFENDLEARDKFMLWVKLATLATIPQEKSKFRLSDFEDFSAQRFADAAKILLGGDVD